MRCSAMQLLFVLCVTLSDCPAVLVFAMPELGTIRVPAGAAVKLPGKNGNAVRRSTFTAFNLILDSLEGCHRDDGFMGVVL